MSRIRLALLLLLTVSAIYLRLNLPYAALVWIFMIFVSIGYFIVELFRPSAENGYKNTFYSALTYSLLTLVLAYSLFMNFQPLRMLLPAGFWNAFDTLALFSIGALSLFALSNLARVIRTLRTKESDPSKPYYIQKIGLISCILVIIHIPEYRPVYDPIPTRDYPIKAENIGFNSSTKQQLDSTIVAFKTKHAIKGLSVFVRSDSSSYEANLGFVSLENMRRPKETDIYQIASVSKTLTASLYADLLSKGEIDSTLTLGDIYDTEDLSHSLAKVKISDLATHTSGLNRLPPSGLSSLFKNMMAPYMYYSSSNFEEDLRNVTVTEQKKHSYSNFGYALLGQAICKYKGVPYSEGRGLLNLLRINVLQPYNMEQVGITNETKVEQRFYAGSFAPNGLEIPGWENPVLHGMGLFNASLNDLKAYVNGYLKDFSQDDFGSTYMSWWATKSFRVQLSEKRIQRTGWVEDEMDAKTFFWHNGSTYGNTSFVGFSPEGNKAVVVLSNTGIRVDDLAVDLFALISYE